MDIKINQLITYANDMELLDCRDNIFMFNQLCYLMDYTPTSGFKTESNNLHVDDILNDLAKIHFGDCDSSKKELFKSKLIGTIIERPSNVQTKFKTLYKQSPKLATDYFYNFALNTNYVKQRQVAKNICYKVSSPYGDMDITINLAKPEKSTKEIEMSKQVQPNNWPKCFLCKEQEGFYGSLQNPDRSNHRIVELDINQSCWYLQYSPFSYFNEHCIVLSKTHTDMKINHSTFKNLLNFVEQFPHYMIGSNADIPIVGGSMLTHDHYQAGNYEFPLFNATTHLQKVVDNVKIYSINWPMHTIKLTADTAGEILVVAQKVLNMWLGYSDLTHHIIAYSTHQHNTITPIVRYHNAKFEMYLILRNNFTNTEHPMGIYHVNESRHHIKYENIGLIEAMGLAVLPGRLKKELESLATSDELSTELTKHKKLFEQLKKQNPRDKLQFLYQEVGTIFVDALSDCGVFRYNQQKYIDFINSID